MTTKKTAEEIQGLLAQCIGTEHYYGHWTKAIKWTDGVQIMADECGAHWLVDIVASYQGEKKFAKEPFQNWTIVTTDKHTAVVTCTDGNKNFIGKQVLSYTDFPLIGEFTMWLIDKVLILPSEY